jgi:hypothetical protein
MLAEDSVRHARVPAHELFNEWCEGSGGSRTVLDLEEMVEAVAVEIAGFFHYWADDAPLWPRDDLTIGDHDIRNDARRAALAALGVPNV